LPLNNVRFSYQHNQCNIEHYHCNKKPEYIALQKDFASQNIRVLYIYETRLTSLRKKYKHILS
jgi:hypothetical protein